MKIVKLLILLAAAFAGYIIYQRLYAVNNIASGAGVSSLPSSSGSGHFSHRDVQRSGGIGKIGGVGGVGGNNELKIGPANSFGGGSAAPTTRRHSLELLQAAAKGDHETVRELIQDGAYIDSRDDHRRTPLIYAAWHGHNDICASLLAGGADIGFKDRDGYSAYDYAAGRGQVETISFLLSLTGDKDQSNYRRFAGLIHAVNVSKPELLPDDEKPLPYVNRITPDGWSALHISASTGYVPMARELTAQGASVNLRNLQGRTPIHWAAWNNRAAMIAFLLDNDAAIGAADVAGNTPLLLAVQNNSADAVRMLLARGAKKNTANHDGQTPLMIASDKGFGDIAALLR